MPFYSLTADVIPKNVEKECALEEEACGILKKGVSEILYFRDQPLGSFGRN